MLGNQSQLRNINSSSITAKGCWVNTRSIIDVNTRIRGHIIAGRYRYLVPYTSVVGIMDLAALAKHTN